MSNVRSASTRPTRSSAATTVSASMAFASDCVVAGEPVLHVGCEVVSERGVVAVVDTPASTRPPRAAVQRHRLCASIARTTRIPPAQGP